MGIVNVLSIFCLELQKLLKPIYNLIGKGRQFMWGKEQQIAFYEIKNRLQKPPVFHLPDREGRFQLYSDTSQFAMGSSLYKIQNGKPKLIAYVSKRLPEAARNYFITELVMCGLAINIMSFAHLLKRVDFNAVVAHLALTHIMKSKVEPTTARIKRLLEVLNSYSFNLYCIKGKDMISGDFLSRQNVDDSNPHKIIPISFNMRDILQNRYYNIKGIRTEDKNMSQTRSEAKAGGINWPEVHGVNKGLHPHLRPERQTVKQTVTQTEVRTPTYKPRVGQGRAGLRRKVKVVTPACPKKVIPPIAEK